MDATPALAVMKSTMVWCASPAVRSQDRLEIILTCIRPQSQPAPASKHSLPMQVNPPGQLLYGHRARKPVPRCVIAARARHLLRRVSALQPWGSKQAMYPGTATARSMSLTPTSARPRWSASSSRRSTGCSFAGPVVMWSGRASSSITLWACRIRTPGSFPSKPAARSPKVSRAERQAVAPTSLCSRSPSFPGRPSCCSTLIGSSASSPSAYRHMC
jgi:hypothetical protein